MALAQMDDRAGEMPGRRSSIGVGAASLIWFKRAMTFVPWNGFVPVSNSYKITPRVKMSLDGVSSRAQKPARATDRAGFRECYPMR